MSTNNTSKPVQSFDFSSIGNSSGMIDTLFRLHDVASESAIPAIVKEYDYLTHKVSVQPLVKWVKPTSDGEEGVERPIYTVETIHLRHGGFMIHFPLNVGDTGWLIAGDRDAKTAKASNSNPDWSQNEGAEDPDSFDLQSFKNGFFVPASWVTSSANSKVDPTSFTLMQVEKNGDTYGSMELKSNGSFAFTSTRHEATSDNDFGAVVGGRFEFHSEYQYYSETLNKIVKGIGDIYAVANVEVAGNITSTVHEYTGIGGSVISKVGERSSTMSAGDLDKTDAKFREVSFISRAVDAVTGVVKYFSKKQRILADEEYDVEEVDIGGGGNVDDVTMSSDNIGIVKTVVNKVINFVLSYVITSDDGTVSITNNEDGADLSVGNGTITITDGSALNASFNVNQYGNTSIGISNNRITIKDNLDNSDSFTLNQYSDKEITIEYPVTSVDAKEDEEGNKLNGIDVDPTTGDVKIENTGVTGVFVQQSGANAYTEITGTERSQTDKTLTKDLEITLPVNDKIQNSGEKINSILVNDSIITIMSDTGSAQTKDLVHNHTLKIDAVEANSTLKVNDNDVAHFYGCNTLKTASASVNIIKGLEVTGYAPSYISGSNEIITAIKYDSTDHQIKVKIRKFNEITLTSQGKVLNYVSPESDWIMMEGGQCVEHTGA